MDNLKSSRLKFFRSLGIFSPLTSSSPNSENIQIVQNKTFRKKNKNLLKFPSTQVNGFSDTECDLNTQSNTQNNYNNNYNNNNLNNNNNNNNKNDIYNNYNNINNNEDLQFHLSSMQIHGKDDFRINYLRKLSYANIWVPSYKKPPSHQTVCIFDWDDTLLCTSYINTKGDSNIKNDILKHQFDLIQKFGKLLLELALTLGKTFIITNAKEGWVQYSSNKYLPALTSVLQKITVISARKHFEEVYPGNYHEWKVRAFMSVRNNLNSQIVTNLISVGDSEIEMHAVHVMGREFSDALIKTIKFKEDPSPNELAKQLEIVYSKFEHLCSSPKSLKIGLEKINPTPLPFYKKIVQINH